MHLRSIMEALEKGLESKHLAGNEKVSLRILLRIKNVILPT